MSDVSEADHLDTLHLAENKMIPVENSSDEILKTEKSIFAVTSKLIRFLFQESKKYWIKEIMCELLINQ